MTNDFETLFSPEEREVIQKCIDTGMLDSVPSALESAGFFTMNPDREKALEKHLASFRTVSDEGSEVLSELQKKEMEEGYRISTPEEEREWQARIDKEREEKQAKARERAGLQGAMTSASDSTDKFSLSKVQIMEKLKEKGISFSAQQSKAELASLLEAS